MVLVLVEYVTLFLGLSYCILCSIRFKSDGHALTTDDGEKLMSSYSSNIRPSIIMVMDCGFGCEELKLLLIEFLCRGNSQ